MAKRATGGKGFVHAMYVKKHGRMVLEGGVTIAVPRQTPDLRALARELQSQPSPPAAAQPEPEPDAAPLPLRLERQAWQEVAGEGVAIARDILSLLVGRVEVSDLPCNN